MGELVGFLTFLFVVVVVAVVVVETVVVVDVVVVVVVVVDVLSDFFFSTIFLMAFRVKSVVNMFMSESVESLLLLLLFNMLDRVLLMRLGSNLTGSLMLKIGELVGFGNLVSAAVVEVVDVLDDSAADDFKRSIKELALATILNLCPGFLLDLENFFLAFPLSFPFLFFDFFIAELGLIAERMRLLSTKSLSVGFSSRSLTSASLSLANISLIIPLLRSEMYVL